MFAESWVPGHRAMDSLGSRTGLISDDPSNPYPHHQTPLLSQSSCGDTTSNEQPPLFVSLFAQFGRRWRFIFPPSSNANKERAVF